LIKIGGGDLDIFWSNSSQHIPFGHFNVVLCDITRLRGRIFHEAHARFVPVGSKKRPRGRPDGPQSGLSTVVARTVHACAEIVKVPSFSRDLLSKTVELTRKSVRSGSRPHIYIDEGLQPIEPSTIDQIKSISCFYLTH
jgi:hypothetical protein